MAVKYNLEVKETSVNHDNNYSVVYVYLSFTFLDICNSVMMAVLRTLST